MTQFDHPCSVTVTATPRASTSADGPGRRGASEGPGSRAAAVLLPVALRLKLLRGQDPHPPAFLPSCFHFPRTQLNLDSELVILFTALRRRHRQTICCNTTDILRYCTAALSLLLASIPRPRSRPHLRLRTVRIPFATPLRAAQPVRPRSWRACFGVRVREKDGFKVQRSSSCINHGASDSTRYRTAQHSTTRHNTTSTICRRLPSHNSQQYHAPPQRSSTPSREHIVA